MEIIHNIALDVSRHGVQAAIPITRGEVGVHRLVVTLRNKGVPIIFDEGDTAVVYIDNDTFDPATIYTKNGAYPNSIVYDVTARASNKLGVNTATFQISQPSMKMMFTADIVFNVCDNRTYKSEVLDSPPYAAVLKAQHQAEELCKQAEDTIKSIEPRLLEVGISENSLKMHGNTAGLKGFYWSKVEDDYFDNTSQTINLSTKNGDFGTEQEFDIREFWDIGDKITVHSDQHHIDCAEILGYYNENGKWIGILVTKLPFTPTNESAHHTDQAVYVLEKPDKGLVDFGQYAVAFGDNCKALGWGNITAGTHNEALDQYGAVFGNSNKVGYASGALGKENEALGMAALVAGGKSKANGKSAIALGRHLNVEGEYNFAANSANKVYGRANAALNGSNQEFPNDNTSDGNTVRGIGNLAIGRNNSTDDNAKYSLVGGNGSFATNESSIALGTACHATGLASQAMGYDCNALGNTSHASGARSEATGSGSFAHGDGVKATARGQAVFGNYNATNANALFQVGNGTSGAPSNAFEVLADGSAKLGNKKVATAEDILPISAKLETVESIAKGANQALAFSNYQAMITEFNSAPFGKYNPGQNIYIRTLDVPDLWVCSAGLVNAPYNYTTDEDFITELIGNKTVLVGNYYLSRLETQKIDLTEYPTISDMENYVNETIGDVETVLDNIIAIQNSLIGGETV